MKTSTSISGFIALGLVILGSLFKIQHWPGAGLMLVVGTTFFAFIFLPLLLIYKLKNKRSSMDVVEAIILFIMLLFFSLGLLFKVQHWPGGSLLLFVSGILFAIVFLPIFLIQFYRTKEYKKSINILNILMVVAGLLMVLSVNVSKNVLMSYVLADELCVRNNITMLKANEQSVKLMESDTGVSVRCREVHELTTSIYKTLNEYKRIVITGVEYDLPAPSGTNPYSTRGLSGKDNYDIPTFILIGANPSSPRNDDWSAIRLKAELEFFRDGLLAFVDDQNSKEEIGALISFDDLGQQNGVYETWELGLFYHMPLVSVINTFSQLQSSCLTAESIALQNIMINKNRSIL